MSLYDPNRGIPLVVLCGPTGAGKTGLAVRLSQHWPVEVVSADSRQVYRGMDIGTAKATAGEQRLVRHHLIDVVDPDDDFSVADFIELARTAIKEIAQRGHRPLAVGGTGLYLRGLTQGLIDAPQADPGIRARLHAQAEQQGRMALWQCLQQVDPGAAAAIHPNNLVRVVRALEVFELTGEPISSLQQRHGFSQRPYPSLKLGICPPREVLFERIAQRVDAMVNDGLFDEVEQLLARGLSPAGNALRTLGYREVVDCLAGKMNRDEAVERIKTHTRQYAKRQLTWFHKDPEIIWVDSLREFATIHELIDKFYSDVH
ncbi:MAG: tRNA (adenosine(37)-N6)-dimethylallyltransferase MiaA [Geoalkalibacter sp.]|uniref:tRNA (adenosine(37)-N6)-dimethylallyltransferase MiaA n=1 Tax=Geoalkalibacter sp. TaxID=3041440 RepID=UPI003D0DB007